MQASPNSQVVVEAGVCIGTGVVIQAYGGKLTLSVGANVGQGTLLLGSGIIGPQACIGADSTLINPAIAANQVVPAHSLLGDTSRSLETDPEGIQEATADDATPETSTTPSDPAAHTDGAIATNGAVYGREQVLQLVQTLFPYRDATMSDADSE